MCLLISVLSLPILSAQSIQELQRLKAEYEKFQKGQNQLQLPVDIQPGIDPLTGLPKEARLTPYNLKEDVLDQKDDDGLKHYGYDFFTRRDTATFW